MGESEPHGRIDGLMWLVVQAGYAKLAAYLQVARGARERKGAGGGGNSSEDRWAEAQGWGS